MRPDFRSERRSWGVSYEFAYDLPDLPSPGVKRRPRRLAWFALGLVIGLLPVLLLG